MSGFTFVTRRNCPLCDKVEPWVATWAERLGATLDRVLVDDDPELLRRFGTRVPVVLGPNGSVLAEGRINQRELAKAMRGARRDSRPAG